MIWMVRCPCGCGAEVQPQDAEGEPGVFELLWRSVHQSHGLPWVGPA